MSRVTTVIYGRVDFGLVFRYSAQIGQKSAIFARKSQNFGIFLPKTAIKLHMGDKNGNS